MSHQHDDARGNPRRVRNSHSPNYGPFQLFDLDAEVLAGPLNDACADIGAAIEGPVRRILDLGTGTGAGTFRLLGQFADSRAVAVDRSIGMLEHVRRRAEQLGLADRITTVHADLDEGVPGIDQVDLVWASGFLHHLIDPDRTMSQVASLIRPGGLLSAIELTGHPRFLPDGAPGARAEAAAHGLLDMDRSTDMPTMGSDWAARFVRAGLILELDCPIMVDIAPPLPEVAGTYAFATLSRIRSAVAGRLAAVDLADLERLLDGGVNDVRHRRDLRITTRRRLLIARAPVRSV